MKYTKEEISNILISLNAQYGGINETILRESKIISRRPVRTHFGNISNAIKELGLNHIVKSSISRKGLSRKVYTKDEILPIVKEIESKYGYFSKGLIDLNGPEYGKINHKVIVRLWGSFSNLYKQENITQKPSQRGVKINPNKYYINLLKEYINKYSITELSTSSLRRICSDLNISTQTLDERGLTTRILSNILKIKYSKRRFLNEENRIKIVSKILNEIPVKQYKCDKIKNRRKLPIDAYFTKSNIALEYNGEQHYIFVNKFHKSKNDLYKQIKRDKKKYKKIYKSGMKLLIIKYSDNLQIITNKINKLMFP